MHDRPPPTFQPSSSPPPRGGPWIPVPPSPLPSSPSPLGLIKINFFANAPTPRQAFGRARTSYQGARTWGALCVLSSRLGSGGHTSTLPPSFFALRAFHVPPCSLRYSPSVVARRRGKIVGGKTKVKVAAENLVGGAPERVQGPLPARSA